MAALRPLIIRPLFIDDAARAKVAAVLSHAEKHPYRPGGPIPGDDPRFVVNLNSYRVVFSFTQLDHCTFRHLSVSVPGKKYPNPVAVFVIADLFGFTGYDEKFPASKSPSWMIDVNKDCVILAEPIMPATSKAWSN